MTSEPLGPIACICYLPDFISLDVETRLINEVHASKAQWVPLNGRRAMAIGGSVHAGGLIPAPMPSWSQSVIRRIMEDPCVKDLFDQVGGAPNHVLVNSYSPGEGIMPHEDGPAYAPAVAILSLGNPAVLRFRKKLELRGDLEALPVPGTLSEKLASFLLMPRSLILFSNEAYTSCLHYIERWPRDGLEGEKDYRSH